METPSYNVRSVGFWLKMPIVGPILCLLLIYVVLGLVPDTLAALVLWALFAVGCIAICMNLTRVARHVLRR